MSELVLQLRLNFVTAKIPESGVRAHSNFFMNGVRISISEYMNLLFPTEILLIFKRYLRQKYVLNTLFKQIRVINLCVELITSLFISWGKGKHGIDEFNVIKNSPISIIIPSI